MNNREHAADLNGVNQDSLDKPVWGAKAIGEVIGRNPRQAFHLLSNGHIKSARQIGGRWVASRAALLRELGAAS